MRIEDTVRCPCGFKAPLKEFPIWYVRMDVNCVETIHVCPKCGRGF